VRKFGNGNGNYMVILESIRETKVLMKVERLSAFSSMNSKELIMTASNSRSFSGAYRLDLKYSEKDSR